MTGTFVRADRGEERASLTAAMRTSNHSAFRRPWLRSYGVALSLIVVGLLVAACGDGAAASTAPPTPTPTPVVTPNPQMTDPASAAAVFTAIARAKLPIVANNAASGKDPVNQINATYHDWPLLISEYKSAASLAKAKPWTPGDPPKRGEAPVSIIGLNILIEWGPTTGAKPPILAANQILVMDEFLNMIGPYIGPLTVRSSTPLDVPGSTAAPTPDASPSAKASAVPGNKPKASP